MRRRAPTGVPAELLTFDLEQWADGGATDFERYERALHRWQEARDAWATANGFDGDRDETWNVAGWDAILNMPDEPWDPSTI